MYPIGVTFAPWTGLATMHDNSSYRALRRLNYGQRQEPGKEW